MSAQPRKHVVTDERASLAQVVNDPARIDDCDAATVGAILVEIAAIEARLAARLAEVAHMARDPVDQLLDVHEASARLGVAEDWVRRRNDELPFVVRVGGAVRYSARGIERWVQKRTGTR